LALLEDNKHKKPQADEVAEKQDEEMESLAELDRRATLAESL